MRPWEDRPPAQKPDTEADCPSGPIPRILVVEDQEDLRQMLATALRIEGYAVDEASTGAEGLTRLGRAAYDLVLSDYAMPGGTGIWMLQEAGRRGLMGSAAALIVTAHPDVRDVGGLEIIQKPLDLDFLLEQVRRILSAGEEDEDRAAPAGSVRDSRDGPRRAHRIELALYISSASPASIQARRNLDRVLARFELSQVKLTVHDMIREPQAGDADRIAFTPTLVKRYPEPRVWMLGNLRDTDALADLLVVCGVDEKA